jgi:lysozyme
MFAPELQNALRCAAACVYGTAGFRDTAFIDMMSGVPVWTIGHGTISVDGDSVHAGMTCTRLEAEAWTMADMERTGETVCAAVKAPVGHMQLGALISLAYSIGIGRFLASSVLEMLNGGQALLAADRMLDYDKSDDHYMPGRLVTRRQRERALFLAGMGIAHNAPLDILTVAAGTRAMRRRTACNPREIHQ